MLHEKPLVMITDLSLNDTIRYPLYIPIPIPIHLFENHDNLHQNVHKIELYNDFHRQHGNCATTDAINVNHCLWLFLLHWVTLFPVHPLFMLPETPASTEVNHVRKQHNKLKYPLNWAIRRLLRFGMKIMRRNKLHNLDSSYATF